MDAWEFARGGGIAMCAGKARLEWLTGDSMMLRAAEWLVLGTASPSLAAVDAIVTSAQPTMVNGHHTVRMSAPLKALVQTGRL